MARGAVDFTAAPRAFQQDVGGLCEDQSAMLAEMIAPIILLIIVHLAAQNGSNETGTVMLAPVAHGTRVSISVTGEPAGAVQPANIHAGDCNGVEQVRYVLRNVRNGRSTSVVPVLPGDLKKRRYVIVLQGSRASLRAAKAYRYVSCGAI